MDIEIPIYRLSIIESNCLEAHKNGHQWIKYCPCRAQGTRRYFHAPGSMAEWKQNAPADGCVKI